MDMDNVWEKIKKSLKDGATMSIEKIDEYTKIGKLKVDEMAAKRKIERNFLDMGERYYDLIKDGREGDAAGDLVIKKAAACIDSLYAEVAEIAEKIKEVHCAAKKAGCCEDGCSCEDEADADDSGV